MSVEIDPSILQTAEHKKAQIVTAGSAREVAGIAEAVFRDFTDSEVLEILRNDTQKLIFACLLEIDVSARTTAANSEEKPIKSFSDIEAGTRTVSQFYRDQRIRESLIGVEKDHRGRPHNFLPEMQRDEVNLAIAASAFYLGDDKERLIEFAKNTLTNSIEKLPENHPTRPVLLIESQLLGELIGDPVDEEILIKSMQELVARSSDNIARIASVTAWVQAYGERHNRRQIVEEAGAIFQDCVEKQISLGHLLTKARLKPNLRKTREMLIKVDPHMVSPERKSRVLRDLTAQDN